MIVTAAEIFITLLWAIVPPALAMLWYARRLKSAPNRRVLFGLFVLGAIAGCVAAGMQWSFNWGAMQIPGWLDFARSTLGQLLRQFGVTAPIEELCKLATVVLVLRWLWVRSGKCQLSRGRF
ncbi:MAG: hypothetical protein HC860_10020 [Alkalinema sp. RU_4_3]|nr:hypothetical protein [Alkalinema sp. RU_4_3]